MSDSPAEHRSGPTRPGLSLHRAQADTGPAAALVAAMAEELDAIYSRYDGDLNSIPAPPEMMAPPHGTFLIAVEDAAVAGDPLEGAVACGGLKKLAPGLAEIKRMFVLPRARGRGLGAFILEALEHEARELGYERIRLDTGALQPQARAIYEAAGYESISDYNGNPYASFWFERRL